MNNDRIFRKRTSGAALGQGRKLVLGKPLKYLYLLQHKVRFSHPWLSAFAMEACYLNFLAARTNLDNLASPAACSIAILAETVNEASP
jgi:hypothetical protein